jgi:uncharacterized protein (DUF58 family)
MRLTSRGWIALGAVLVFYFFANQTQVGWLYVLTALIAGAWLSTLLVPRRALRRLSLTRRIEGAQVVSSDEIEIHAGRTATITLDLQNHARFPALLVRGLETCPFAAAAERSRPFFVESVAGRSNASLAYDVLCMRRGWFEFPPVELSSRAPFGFVAARRQVNVPSGVLVLPEYRELDRIGFFDRTRVPQHALPQPGPSGEFLGVREYRPGDSLRHIHWRTTAHANQLIVREFEDDNRPSLVLALDLRAESAIGSEEDNSLELAIKIAASLAHYAYSRQWSVSLATNSALWPPPPGPLSRWGLMNFLARVQAGNAEPFASCLVGQQGASLVVGIFSAPDREAAEALLGLRRLGTGVWAVIIDHTAPADFQAVPDQNNPAQDVAGMLKTGGVTTRVIGSEPNWEDTLSED